MSFALPETKKQVSAEGPEPEQRNQGAGARVGVADADRRHPAPRTVIVVSADAGVRHSLTLSLETLRWTVRESSGGAQAMMLVAAQAAEAMIVDSWLPDLEVAEFVETMRQQFRKMDVLLLQDMRDGEFSLARRGRGKRGDRTGTRRNELLYAMRLGANGAGAAAQPGHPARPLCRMDEAATAPAGEAHCQANALLPEIVGGGAGICEVARLVQLVAPRRTAVLIQGETGTGKELVARVVHRLSPRSGKPFIVLNCAAIPESLLEAELFGHTRGAFTGAVQSRMGRIEAADGGTLLLDEIGEMPLGMQAKMLRFIESGELQRVGDNSTTQVNVRLIAATHQPLEQRAEEGRFRLDLYHRLAVFPIDVPPLRERMEDIPALTEHFLEQMGQDWPRKRLGAEALAQLQQHTWPGNVRELMHVLERAVILTGSKPEIGAPEIRYRRKLRE